MSPSRVGDGGGCSRAAHLEGGEGPVEAVAGVMSSGAPEGYVTSASLRLDGTGPRERQKTTAYAFRQLLSGFPSWPFSSPVKQSPS
jgi:hypothetical protein